MKLVLLAFAAVGLGCGGQLSCFEKLACEPQPDAARVVAADAPGTPGADASDEANPLSDAQPEAEADSTVDASDAGYDSADVCIPEVFVANMTATMMPAPVTTTSTGVARVELACDGKTVSYSFRLMMKSDAQLTSAHAHRSDGTSAIWVFSAPGAGPPGTAEPAAERTGTTMLSSGDVASLRAGTLYADVHTFQNPMSGGEIRGWFARE